MPRMRCEKAFLNNATYAVPARLAIKVKSDTDALSGVGGPSGGAPGRVSTGQPSLARWV